MHFLNGRARLVWVIFIIKLDTVALVAVRLGQQLESYPEVIHNRRLERSAGHITTVICLLLSLNNSSLNLLCARVLYVL